MAPQQPPTKDEKPGLLRSIGHHLNNFEFYISALALLGLVALLAISVGARYVAGLSVPWSEEVARFTFVAVIFASISYAAKEHRHIRVTMFVDKLFSGKARTLVFTLGDLVWLGYNAVVLYAVYVVLADMIEFPYNSAVLNLPMYFVYALIPIFFVTISIRILRGIIVRLGGEDIDGFQDELS